MPLRRERASEAKKGRKKRRRDANTRTPEIRRKYEGGKTEKKFLLATGGRRKKVRGSFATSDAIHTKAETKSITYT